MHDMKDSGVPMAPLQTSLSAHSMQHGSTLLQVDSPLTRYLPPYSPRSTQATYHWTNQRHHLLGINQVYLTQQCSLSQQLLLHLQQYFQQLFFQPTLSSARVRRKLYRLLFYSHTTAKKILNSLNWLVKTTSSLLPSTPIQHYMARITRSTDPTLHGKNHPFNRPFHVDTLG